LKKQIRKQCKQQASKHKALYSAKIM